MSTLKRFRRMSFIGSKEDLFGSTFSLNAFKDGLKTIKQPNRKSWSRNTLVVSLLDELGIKGTRPHKCALFNEIGNILKECDREISRTDWQLIFCTILGHYSALKNEELQTKMIAFWKIVAQDMWDKHGEEEDGFTYSLKGHAVPLIQTYQDLGERSDKKWSNIVKPILYILLDITCQFESLDWDNTESLHKETCTVVLASVFENYIECDSDTTKDGLVMLLNSYINKTNNFACTAPDLLIEKFETLLHFSVRTDMLDFATLLLDDDMQQTSVNERDSSGHTPAYYVKSIDLLSKMLDLPCISYRSVMIDMEKRVLNLLDNAKSEDDWIGFQMCKTILCHPKLGVIQGKECSKIMHLTLQVSLKFKDKLATDIKEILETMLTFLSESSKIDLLDQDKLFAEIYASKQYEYFTMFQEFDALENASREVVNKPNESGMHVLFELIENVNENMKVIHSVLKISNIDINPKDANGKSLFILSLEQGYEQFAKSLTQHQTFDILECSGDYLQKVVHYLVKSSMSHEMLDTLLEMNECGIDEKDDAGYTPLYYALEQRNWKLASELCLNDNVDINVANIPHQLVNQPKRTILKEPTEKNKMVDLPLPDSLNDNVDIDVSDISHPLVKKPKRTILQELIAKAPNKRIDLLLKDSKGNTVLHRACKKASLDLITEIISVKLSDTTNFNILNGKLETPLHVAIKMLTFMNTQKWISNSDCTKPQQRKVVSYLFEEPSVDVNVKDKDGNAVIHTVLSANKIEREVLSEIVKRQDFDVNLPNADGNSAIHIMASQFSAEVECIRKELFSMPKIDWTLGNNNRDTVLHLAVDSKLTDDTIDFVIEKSIPVINQKNINGSSILGMAVKAKKFSLAKKLLELKEINPNISVDGEGLLAYSIRHPHKVPTDLVLNHPSLDINYEDDDGATCLHRVMKNDAVGDLPSSDGHSTKSVKKLKKLISREGIDIGNLKTLLSKENIDIYKEDKYGYSPFLLAIMNERPLVVDLFRQHSTCDVSHTDSRGQPLIFYAVEYLQPRNIRPFLMHKTFKANAENYYNQKLKDIYDSLDESQKTPKLWSLIKEALASTFKPPDLLKQKLKEMETILDTYDNASEDEKDAMRFGMKYLTDAVTRIEQGTKPGKRRHSSGMTLHDQKLLLRNRVYLLEELEPGNILHSLLQYDVIKQDQYDVIDCKKPRKEKVKALLDILPRCGPEAFNSFMNALDDNQPHVKEELLTNPDLYDDDVF